jgi:tRNA(Ile)-lysidine synthetase-like protein
MEAVPAGRYVVAVSGGVDSVVLLDLLTKLGRIEIIVAHFDHGIRPDSHDDARFVEQLAKRHKLPFETRREELGAAASEEYARQRRYAFLRKLAKQYDARLMTAHHADDVIETIAINLHRGTGWRGLAVLDNPLIIRPLLVYDKAQIYAYATRYGLQWREDSTNQSDSYLRNRLRRRLDSQLDVDSQQQLLALWQTQRQLKRHIDGETARLLAGQETALSRYFFTMIDDAVASELLRYACAQQAGVIPTRPQRQRAALAIKVAQPGSSHSVGEAIAFRFAARSFSIEKL